MSEFDYLLDKINSAEFISDPFKHLNILNFFNEEHFEKIISDKQILLVEADNIESLIDNLIRLDYEPQPFPGCITSIKDYIKFVNDPKSSFRRSLIEGYGKEIIEGYGLTMRLKSYDSKFLNRLIDFLNTEKFMGCIMQKFDVTGDIEIETAIQKNLHGYEISPHCDTRRKALTYMVNIYTSAEAEKEAIHTHLLNFKPKWQYLFGFWQHNKDVDTCWVPWDWCETVKETSFNNSICIFRPSYDTLHAVKLDYDHLKFQRNQIYGNLWYKEDRHKYGGDYRMVDLVSHFEKQGQSKIKAKVVQKIKNKLDLL